MGVHSPALGGALMQALHAPLFTPPACLLLNFLYKPASIVTLCLQIAVLVSSSVTRRTCRLWTPAGRAAASARSPPSSTSSRCRWVRAAGAAGGRPASGLHGGMLLFAVPFRKCGSLVSCSTSCSTNQPAASSAPRPCPSPCHPSAGRHRDPFPGGGRNQPGDECIAPPPARPVIACCLL